MTKNELQTTIIGTEEHTKSANDMVSRAMYLIGADAARLTAYAVGDDWGTMQEKVSYRLETEGKRYDITITVVER